MGINRFSYTSASTFPAKLLAPPSFTFLKHGEILPIHIQINPTNKCPLHCSFCSLKKRDRTIEIDYKKLIKITKKFISLGTKAVTITGGGDPLAYPKINQYINFLYDSGLKIGLVTNALLVKNLTEGNKLTWCRVSISDESKDIPDLTSLLESNIDLSFSYVLLRKENPRFLIKAVNYAYTNNFTHIRLVDDILSEETYIDFAKETLNELNISKVIFQGRKQYTKGSSKCYISLLKPNIGPDSIIYPCCGVQYALSPPALDFDSRTIMCKEKDIEKHWSKQLYFNGSICRKCYYSAYNENIEILLNLKDLKHKEFV